MPSASFLWYFRGEYAFYIIAFVLLLSRDVTKLDRSCIHECVLELSYS